MSVLNENGILLALIMRECGSIITEQYKDLLCKKDKKEYWEDFGFMYVGVFAENTNECFEIIKKSNEIKNKQYAISIMNALYYEEHNKGKLQQVIKGQEIFLRMNSFSKEEKEVLAKAILMYLADYVSKYDEMKIYQLSEKIMVNEREYFKPVCNKEKNAFGVVYTWPGSISAESELMERIKRAAKDVGVKIYCLSDSGNILDDNQLETQEYVTGEEMQFLITLHYEDNKMLDTYYYHALWNPPEIPLGTDYYEGKVVDNYLMNDDYLIYDAGGMSNHLRSIIMNKPRDIEEASCFVGSFPGSIVKEPRLENPKLFYCGMNWEVVLSKSNRHEGLFKLLDETDKVCFYGPNKVEAWGGMRPWEGYKCYQGEIPFDGFTILNEINKCGICLAISSDIHRRAGAVTNRAYEACAAGAVIITDNNEFMEKNFKDAVLFVNYNKNNPRDTFNQIMEKYNWIIEHPKEALALARKSQMIFLEKFSMDNQLLQLIEKHGKRFETISRDLFAKNEDKMVLVSGVINTQNEQEAYDMADRLIKNMQIQYYRNIQMTLACDEKLAEKLTHYVQKKDVRIRISNQNLFDEKGSRRITDGQALSVILKETPHDFFVRTKENEVWFCDHITTLIRIFEDEPDAVCAYSGVAYEREDGYKTTASFGKIGASDIYYHNWGAGVVTTGQFLFRSECHQFIPEFTLNCIDGLEYCLYLNLLYFKYHKKIVFSKRMTCRYLYEMKCKEMSVLSKDMQIKYIRGMVKYDLPEGGMGKKTGGEGRELSRIFAEIPLKSWIKLRYYQHKIWKGNLKPEKRKKVEEQYQKILKDYSEKFDKIL